MVRLSVFQIVRQKEKYSYTVNKRQARLVNIVGAMGILSVLALLYGYYNFLNISPWLKAFLFIPFLIIASYHLITYFAQLVFPGFDIREHEHYVKQYWASNKEPKVSVVIPACGESVSVVRKTVTGALKIEYKNKRVYVLDDTKNGIYKDLCRQLGCGYVNRTNVGENKKAGNLNYAMRTLPASDFLLVLDADFVPRSEMLREMVPYALDDISIVQTPQHFSISDATYYKSKVAFGAALMQREFYRITQVARDRFGAAICVGTNALYRRSAIVEVGGYQGVRGYGPWQHSEDVHTGLKTLNFIRPNGRAYRIKYLPIQLAKGTCPEDYYSFYKQQNRWCTGSLQLLFSKKTLFSKVLNPVQKIFYFSNGLYYLYTIFILLAPIQLLVINLVDASYSWGYTMFFIPSLLMTLLVVPYVYRREPEPLAFWIVITATSFTFLQALYLLIRQRPLGWEPTGQKALGKNRRYTEFKTTVVLYFVMVYVAGLITILLNDGFGVRSTIFLQSLFLFSLLGHTVHLYYLLVASNQRAASWYKRLYGKTAPQYSAENA
jgi:cellulose synthase/poly-beta-1,6-N-acetylglucosamine synthase-like glycosyltransferase